MNVRTHKHVEGESASTLMEGMSANVQKISSYCSQVILIVLYQFLCYCIDFTFCYLLQTIYRFICNMQYTIAFEIFTHIQNAIQYNTNYHLRVTYLFSTNFSGTGCIDLRTGNCYMEYNTSRNGLPVCGGDITSVAGKTNGFNRGSYCP